MARDTAQLQNNPLERNLGFFDFGRYHKADATSKFAFEKVGELMGYEIELGDEDSEDENDDGNKGDDDVEAATQSEKETQQPPSLPTDSLQIEVGKKIDSTCPTSPATLRRELVRKVQASKDKLFLIARHRHSHKLAAWHMVQVDKEETSWRRAKEEGIFHVRYYVRSYGDSKKRK